MLIEFRFPQLRYQLWVLPFRPEVRQMEFRIYNIIFCEMYRMKRSVQFNEYVSIVFEKYILNLIETRPIVSHIFFLLRNTFHYLFVFILGLVDVIDTVNFINGAIAMVKSCRLVWRRMSSFERMHC